MWNLVWVLLWESLPTLTAYPLNPTIFSESNSHSYWEVFGILGVTATAFTLVGCLCCRRNRRPKGFQEFKNGNDADVSHSFHGLELEVPQEITPDCVQFEPLPVERFIGEVGSISKPKPPPPSPSLFGEKDTDQPTVKTYQEWQTADLHIPRETLKYVKEVGHGWFGKVVEGCIDLSNLKRNLRSGNVVVKILTEEATAKEKAWFLGEATPYVKLRHRNILSLFGSCLETDPYLLLFESCPLGDLKSFLRANNDPQSQKTLTRENMPTRIAIEVAAGLRHMHEHGFSHTDLSARNCLVASDLSIKLGDYGIGVEKYPRDYYVVGDRALPIRWSAPESLLCTETTIETREITPRANIWNYAILLWEIATWGQRPYDDLDDEQVIQMLLSTSPKAESTSLKLLIFHLDDSQNSMTQAIQSCMTLDPAKRPDLAELRHTLLKEKLDEEDFEQRWENLKPAKLSFQAGARSASLQDLRGSVDSELWTNVMEEKSLQTQQTSFLIGPEAPIKNIPGTKMTSGHFRESDSDAEEESMRIKIEREAYTEKVKQKSKSVADLMVLVYIDPDSDADLSLGPQVSEKSMGRRSLAYGSDGDLRSAVLADEFDQALKKLREPVNGSSLVAKSVDFPFEKLNAFSLSTDSSQVLQKTKTEAKERIHPAFPFTIGDSPAKNATCFSSNFEEENIQTKGSDLDMTSWNNALDSALEGKMSDFLAEAEFHGTTELREKGDDTGYNSTDTVQLTPQSLESDTELMGVENSESQRKQSSIEEEEEEYRKRGSTPDDERSSDSGFRDKESCEDEESPLPRLPVKLPDDDPSLAQETAEEQQLRILLELDTILDAEYTGTPTDSLECTVRETDFYLRNMYGPEKCADNERDEIVNTDSESLNDVNENDESATLGPSLEEEKVPSIDKLCSRNEANILDDCGVERSNSEKTCDNENEDDDSSTVSLHSDNSYVSFSLDEEFVAAIRNELREKLPQAQMLVVEPLEPRNEDEETPSVASDGDSRTWDDEDNGEYANEHGSIDISIRYNLYGAPLSPILETLEERESFPNSESQMSQDDSRDASIASKSSMSEEDVLLVNTQTNQALLLQAGDVSDDEDNDFENNLPAPYPRPENRPGVRMTGSGAPLPSPEEESKWQKMSCSYPLAMQDDCMMTTSFASERDWDDMGDVDDDADEEEEEDNDVEFVWKRYDKSRADLIDADAYHRGAIEKMEEEEEEECRAVERGTMEEGESEEEFTPSAWDATLLPHRSALRSPDKSLKSSDQKKSVWFKKQNYHCVYEYPKEVSTVGPHEQSTTSWEPTTYADWEEMIDESRLDFYPLEYHDASNEKDDEFYVTSSNRPFQLQIGNDKFASQFFPGASLKMSQRLEKEEGKDEEKETAAHCSNQVSNSQQQLEQQQFQQLGELRHTRDRLKLNLLSSNGASVASTVLPAQNNNEDSVELENDAKKKAKSTDSMENRSENCDVGNETSLASEGNVVQSKKLSPSGNGRDLDFNENCGFLEHG